MAEEKDDQKKDKAKATKAKAAGASAPKTKKAEAAADKPAKAKAAKKSTGAKRPARGGLTKFAKAGEYPEKWHLVDAAGQTLGRLGAHIATLLMGKNNPYYTPGADTGDHVVVINAEKVRLTGTKLEQKEYNYHTNYPGGIKTFKVKDLLQTHPDRVIQWAVWGMLPKAKGHLVRHWYKKLRVYAGANHPHLAQKPQPVKLPNLGMNAQ